MSKIAFIADVHVGNHRQLGGEYVGRLNERARECVRILKDAAARATALGCESLVVCGDLFDTDNPSPPMVQAVRDALSFGPQTVHLVLGNHEMNSDVADDHALSSIRGSYVVDFEVYDTTGLAGNTGILAIPFMTGPANSWLPHEIVKVTSGGILKPKAIAFHLGVSDSQTSKEEPWMMGCHDQIHVDRLFEVMRSNGIKAAFAGNWHKSMFWQKDDMIVYQIGALVPTGWNNAGGDEFYGSLVVWDSLTNECVRHVIQGPRYLKFDSVEAYAPFSGNELIRARIEVSLDNVEAGKVQLARTNPFGFAEVVPSAASAKQAAREAGQAAKSLAYGEDDLSRYVYDQGYDESVTKLATDYLTKAKGAAQ